MEELESVCKEDYLSQTHSLVEDDLGSVVRALVERVSQVVNNLQIRQCISDDDDK